MNEQRLAAIVLKHVQDKGWQTRSEVVFRDDDGGRMVCDILMRSAAGPDRFAACECKMSLNPQLLAQAQRLRPFVHWVWVAVPLISNGDKRVRQIMLQSAKAHDIGVIEVNMATDDVVIRCQPSRMFVPLDAAQAPTAFAAHRDDLSPAAGSAGGKRYDPRKDTWEPVRMVLEANGPLPATLIAMYLGWKKQQRLDFVNRMNKAGILGITATVVVGERVYDIERKKQ